MVAVPVTGRLRMAVVGTPSYFATHPAPATPHDLRKHRGINFRLPSAGTIYKWEFEQGHRKMEVGVDDGPPVFDDEEMVIRTRAGHGGDPDTLLNARARRAAKDVADLEVGRRL